MPFRRNHKRVFRRNRKRVARSFKRHGFKKHSKVSKLTLRGPFMPDKFMVKMSSTQMGTLTIPASDSLIQSQFPANYFAGDFTTDSPPNGFGRYARFYQGARILGCSMTVTFINNPINGGFTPTSPVVGVYPIINLVKAYASNQNILLVTDTTQLLGQPYCKYRTLSDPGGMDRTTLKIYQSTKKVFGRLADQEDNYAYSWPIQSTGAPGPTFTTVPGNQWQYVLFAGTSDSTALNDTGVQYIIKQTYYIQFEDRVNSYDL